MFELNVRDLAFLRLPRFLCFTVHFVVACLWFAKPAISHPMPFSYLALRLAPDELHISLRAHTIDLAHELGLTSPALLLNQTFLDGQKDKILALYRSRLVITADGERLDTELQDIQAVFDKEAVELRSRARWSRIPGILNVECRLFPYDSQHQTFTNIYEGERLAHQEIFTIDHTSVEYYTGTGQGRRAVLKKFIPAGIQHIFIGPDHILFILGLMLLGGRLVQLLKIVTAFTIAHSVTLALAALNIYNPPSQVIEPAIALSIVYVGTDNLMIGQRGRDMRVWIALCFGLLHGFGFANVLREFGLPDQALGWSLFSFNAGVEIGQACIVVIAAPVLAFLHTRKKLLAQRVVTIGSVCVILAGVYWFVQRLVAPG